MKGTFNSMTLPKNIAHMINFIAGDITDSSCWPSFSLTDGTMIDTIVNAANPTLMGSNQGVDGTLHNRINTLSYNGLSFNDNICKELETIPYNNAIRCKRGHAITTNGYGLCNKIIHVVGSKYDGKLIKKTENDVEKTLAPEPYICSSSCIHTLESCYHNIVEEIKKNPDIKFIGIPIVGAGEYKFPFDLAVNIAVASIGNALINWKLKDEEYFEMVSLEKIYFFVYGKDDNEMTQKLLLAKQIFNKYKPYFRENKQVVFQTSTLAHFRYMKELWKYDSQKGYFAIARGLRFFLMIIRSLFIPSMRIKDFFGQMDWHKRRQVVEVCVLLKTFFPLTLWYVLHFIPKSFRPWLETIFTAIIIIFLIDTVTYLLTLIIMADVQRPSANIIRSMIMLFINYIEISFDLTFLYYVQYKVRFREALAFGFLNEQTITELDSLKDYLFAVSNTGLKFFLVTLVFGYFFNHMHQREFRS